MVNKRVKVTLESETDRNLEFFDNYKKRYMTRKQFVTKIKKKEYPKYHIRKINGLETPVSNPDWKEWNNLG